MTQKLRIWRVVPVRNGVQAPTFFVETTEDGREKAEESAIKQARLRTGLGKFKEWNFRLEKLSGGFKLLSVLFRLKSCRVFTPKPNFVLVAKLVKALGS